MTEKDVEDYKRRLSQTRFPPVMSEEVNMTYGYPSHALPQLRDKMLQFDLVNWAKMVTCTV